MEEWLGRKLKDDVTTHVGLVLVPGGTVLTREHLHLLQLHRIGPEDIIVQKETDHEKASAALVRSATEYAKELFFKVKTKRTVPILEIKNELIPIVQQASTNPDLFQLFESVKAKDEYTHQHNVGVGVLSTLIGGWMELQDQELALLSLAATMHDVGKVRIPDEILTKPGKLTAVEYEEMKRHTVYGYELLRDTVGLNPRIALVALQHHERSDGTGYPLRLRGNQLDYLGRIVAVADIFHAMSSKRPYHEPLPFYEVVNRMRSGFFGELDPHIVSVFLQNIIRSLVGRRVTLTDGRSGEVVYINPHDDTSPLVKIGVQFLDLSKERTIHIREIIT